MSTSLKKRIINSLFVGVILFMWCCFLYKLLDYREDWLPYSIMWAISWAIGHFVSKTIANAKPDESIIKLLLFETPILCVVSLVILFITGVILNLSNWDYLYFNTFFPFAASLLINNKWIRD